MNAHMDNAHMDNATCFGSEARQYALARPSYPDALFDWISEAAPSREAALDVGTGAGQAAAALADRFRVVHASDVDERQVANAAARKNIRYRVAPACETGLPENAVDAVTVATALHWFDHKAFWREAARVARPGAIFCAWTYHRAVAEAAVERALLAPVIEILEPYWSDGNRLSWRGYEAAELGMPFSVLATPEFACELNWTPEQIAGFVRSWSAHRKARDDGHGPALGRIEEAALEALGDAATRFVLPLHVLAGRVDG